MTNASACLTVLDPCEPGVAPFCGRMSRSEIVLFTETVVADDDGLLFAMASISEVELPSDGGGPAARTPRMTTPSACGAAAPEDADGTAPAEEALRPMRRVN